MARSGAHIWSDVPGEWRAASLRELQARDETAEDDLSFQVSSIHNLYSVFTTLRGFNASFDRMDFHTQGAPGGIYLGRDLLTHRELQRFANQGLHSLFKPGAAVAFTGCNVADSGLGEYFLVRWAQTFMFHGGGIAIGNTGVGLDPLFGGDVYHPTGRWVTVKVGSGGAISLQNHTYLRLDHIRNRIAKLESASRMLASAPQISDIWRSIMTVRDSLRNPTLEARAEATAWLDDTEKELHDLRAARASAANGIPEAAKN
jgi:hypothetical protein